MSKTKKKARSKAKAKSPAKPELEAPQRGKKHWSVIAGAVLALLLVLGLVATAIVPFFQS